MHLRFLSLLVGLAAALPGRAALAQVVAPGQGGEVNPVRVTATTMELSFGTMGQGQGRVIAVALSNNGMPEPLAAVDNQFYKAATVFGQGDPLGKGYVIYAGPGHSVTITGLQPDTYYYFTDAEYNADGTSIIYNTRGSSMSTRTRSAPVAPAPLPVELTAFTGTVDARGTALLRWTTASERNTAFFAVERSADGAAFAEAGRVAAAGASSQPLAYQWPDPQRLTGPTYYRLRQADRDGAVHYSGVVTLSPPAPVARQVDVYPNPSAGRAVQLHLQGYGGESLTLRLADALGRPVLAQALAPANAQYLAPLALPQGLPAGTYFLTLASTSGPIRKRIVVSD
ncbi:T9SS type A sorting domain-containing protein [Hymenobacter caeli]|uniref:T9SS type A sorting domain-containing protein n=1 Tax=Hymenobacter caeli TaxID=2735894 RepID=A0ABX2FTL3_9BACT|nr:T9SS type A sorting domain-containing protein [Hymenobacter caeli]NRT20530.1 hypothetical protein [Hymenobacter caeli]